MSYQEVIEENGWARVLLINDESPEEPYDDGRSPLLRIDRRARMFPAEHINHGGEQYRSKTCDARIEEAALRWGVNDPLFEKYLRAFHGVTKVITWSSDDYEYVTYDDAHWRESCGAPEGSISLDEWRAYCEGEVYGYRVERITRWSADDGQVEDRWTEVQDGSCGGFYGYKWGKEAALEAYEEFVNQVIAEVAYISAHPVNTNGLIELSDGPLPVWTVIGFWSGSEIVVTGVIKGEHNVTGGDVSDFSDEGCWAGSFRAATAEEAEQMAYERTSSYNQSEDE